MPVILIEKQSPKIAVVTLNRPERRNALTIELLAELAAAIKVASDEPHERVLILRGAGAAFCTGLDLKAAADPRKAHATADMVAKTLIALSQTRLITIAAVHGAAVAGGAGIMSACDFVVAAEGTKIGYPEVRRGLVAGLVMPFLLRQVREREVRELLLGGELIDAQRAREIGYRGALLIHPSAVPIANEVFAPSTEEIEWNKGVLRAMAEAERAGRAAVTYDGMMIDYAHVRNALDLLHQAEAFGLDVGEYPQVKAL